MNSDDENDSYSDDDFNSSIDTSILSSASIVKAKAHNDIASMSINAIEKAHSTLTGANWKSNDFSKVHNPDTQISCTSANPPDLEMNSDDENDSYSKDDFNNSIDNSLFSNISAIKAREHRAAASTDIYASSSSEKAHTTLT
eukprot:522049-Ditylum_brightwellii.AAC.1